MVILGGLSVSDERSAPVGSSSPPAEMVSSEQLNPVLLKREYHENKQTVFGTTNQHPWYHENRWTEECGLG